MKNDIILAIDGEELAGSRTFAGIIREYEVGDTITLTILHDGEERDVELTLGKAPTS